MRRRLPILLAALALALAGGSGFLVSTALGTEQQTRTVTINVATGPPGPPGSSACPARYSPGRLVINHPGGQTAIWTCLAD